MKQVRMHRVRLFSQHWSRRRAAWILAGSGAAAAVGGYCHTCTRLDAAQVDSSHLDTCNSDRAAAACANEGLQGRRPAFRYVNNIGSVYTQDGKAISLRELVQGIASSQAEVVLLGEVHDDPVAHRLELEILQGLHQELAGKAKVAVSLEMFERDCQAVVDEYLQGAIREADFIKDARAWPNYEKDYRPLVEYAKDRGLPVIAANAPRRYVSMVGRVGAESLAQLPPDSLRRWLPPLPYPSASAAYRDKFNQTMAQLDHDEGPPTPTTGGQETAAALSMNNGGGGCPHIGLHRSRMDRMMEPMALWDSSMAHAIATHLLLLRRDGSATAADRITAERQVVVHVAGKFHVEGRLGIPEALAQYGGGRLRCVVVAMVPTTEHVSWGFSRERHGALGDYIILTDEQVERSFQVNNPL